MIFLMKSCSVGYSFTFAPPIIRFMPSIVVLLMLSKANAHADPFHLKSNEQKSMGNWGLLSSSIEQSEVVRRYYIAKY